MRRSCFAFLTGLFSAGALLALVGCRTPLPPPKIVYLKNYDMLKKYDWIPMSGAWKAPNVDLRRYQKIIVKPVDLSKINRNEGLSAVNLDSALGADGAKKLRAFAHYTENAFKKAIRKDPRLTLVTQPGPDTMILKLGLIQVVPGKPILGLARNVPIPGKAGFIITPAIKLVGGSVDGLQGSVAIEGDMFDSQTGKIIAVFTDHEKDTTAIINMSLLTAYGTPEEIVDDWAKMFAASLSLAPGQKLAPPPKVKLINL